uniref:Voltage-gated sodium channel n=1 Tax=Candidatus Kentrum sp. SD TaxID=2126332 RepID=A0A450YFD9_9GAMM|nr:MAG: voltage-gated sodium channel [Candidatus Kentron sp. SD]VFK45742.1 MAG: voltage-gated sodium channel [Candidatus Kentron sp. SD]VFK78454.1 MAG: voltage-gated sodium channel [Candidatus Kentron sp. SD]
MAKLREKIGTFVEGQKVQIFVTTLIVLNAITLGLETVPEISGKYSGWLDVFDQFVLGVFVFEILGKLIYRHWRFFLDGWNVFDFLIVGIALIPSSGSLTVLRSLRILRTLRLLSVVPSMRRVVQALFSAIPGIGSVGLLILLIFYVGAVISTKMFGSAFPEWFGTIGESMYTLFQIMTLESWSMGIVRPVLEVFPLAWIFFVPFILITSFTVLNLFIGIIVDAMQSQHMAEQKEIDTQVEMLHADSISLERRLDVLMEELAKIKTLLRAGDGAER